MNEITVKHNGMLLTYTPAPGTDLSKLDIVHDKKEEEKKVFKIRNSDIAYTSSVIRKDVLPTPRFKGGDNLFIDTKLRKPTDVAITSDEPSEAFHEYQEGFWYDDDGEVMPDDERYRFNTEYVQLCKREFDCYLPAYVNKSGLDSNNTIVDMSNNTGPFDNSHGDVRDGSTAPELTRVSVIDIAKYMYDGVPVTTHNMDDAFHILTIVNDTLDKYIGAIPVAPTTFIAPDEWFDPLIYLRESIMEARPGLIKRLATNFKYAGKKRRPRLDKISSC